MTLAELAALMDPADVEASNRIADEAPPLTPSQAAAIRALLGPLMHSAQDKAA